MKKIRLKKGLDIKIEGGITSTDIVGTTPDTAAVVPDDFPGLVPKPCVKPGDRVKAGEALIHDKMREDINIVSPVDGTVEAVVRGERRKLLAVTVKPDNTSTEAVKHDTYISTAESVKALMRRSGLWVLLRQRPYDIIPGDDTPRDIFVTAFDSAPLAPDLSLMVGGSPTALAVAVRALRIVTTGKVYIGVSPKTTIPPVEGAEMVMFEGPHPAGLPGIQAANIRPVNKGETIWTLDIITLWRLGRLIETGIMPQTATVAVTGSEVITPRYVSTVIGADLRSIIGNDIKKGDKHRRIISGNVLTGVHESLDGYLRYPYRQVTVIPEGDDVDEMMGWASLSPSKMSVSPTFPGHFLKRRFAPDARLNGGHRALIMSGEFDKVLPMDILPEYLLKAIISRDIDKMEALGIYEIAPEDMALCEYVDTSKTEIQKLIREGLDYMRNEMA
ncbi:MAG: Na(+)-translocating NADH-quinone reductase subunit A [Pseudoflavonifractor sp.]|nr:Na(+)-translocating NADH-quinone reductase subunit A [Pseudoflavonifractor sp.]